ncbi:MAG: metallophosphoesterase, partial [Pirellulaceae bacterium]|nr:metallophosphoesterase [Pirellulaceae bacterium]
MVNVGSVGQPRDLIPDACYVVADGGQLEFRRIPYPREVTAEKIYAIDPLDNFLGDRLQEGR